MPGRKSNPENYRYGFGGHENDNEINGPGNKLDFGGYGYDTRLGRRFGVDPVNKYHESSYAGFANNPIWFIDPDGRDTTFADNQARKDFLTAYNKTNEEVKRIQNEIEKVKNSGMRERKINKKVAKLEGSLNKWKGLQSDFNNIIQSKSIMFKYSSDMSGLPQGQYGLTTYNGMDFNNLKGEVLIQVRKGQPAYVIHENRHGNQLMNRETGTVSSYDWSDELDAHKAQGVYSPSSVL